MTSPSARTNVPSPARTRSPGALPPAATSPPEPPAAAARCTTAKTGRNLILHEHDDLLRPARRDWPGLRGDYMKHRPNVERAVAQVATFRGRRLKLRYRGETKNNAWLKYRTAALNLRNLTGKGLTRRDGAWALAT